MLVSFVSKSKGKEEYLPKQSCLQFCLKGEEGENPTQTTYFNKKQ